MILGVAGTLAAGKGTVVEYLVQKHGFAHYSSSDILKEILQERDQPLTRPYMSALADELSKEREGGILDLSHERAVRDGKSNYILEAIHRTSEADYIRRIGGKILGVDAKLETRYARTVARSDGAKDDVTFEQFVESSKREDDGATGTGPNIRAVIGEADAVVNNDGSLEDLYGQIDDALKELI
jgi:dephospho-CoA kinase